jgi:hypothetical protein
MFGAEDETAEAAETVPFLSVFLNCNNVNLTSFWRDIPA